MARLFDLEDSGYFYTRLQNPTNDAVAAKIAALEGGVAAMLTSSGQAANFYAIFNICQAGDHFCLLLYHLWRNIQPLRSNFEEIGHRRHFRQPGCQRGRNFRCFPPQYQALFGETISNPTLEVLDIEKFARIAHSHGVPLTCGQHLPYPYQLAARLSGVPTS